MLRRMRYECYSAEFYGNISGPTLTKFYLYIFKLLIVLSTNRLILKFRFIYQNICDCMEVSLNNLNHFIAIDQFSCYLFYIDLTKYGIKHNN